MVGGPRQFGDAGQHHQHEQQMTISSASQYLARLMAFKAEQKSEIIHRSISGLRE
jgi:autonomous glycyl radical cofactor GrcA